MTSQSAARSYAGMRAQAPTSGALDGAHVILAIRHESREVVVEGAMDHAVRLGRPAAQTLQVFEIPAMDLGAGGDERLRSRIRPCQSEHLMAGVDEFRNDG